MRYHRKQEYVLDNLLNRIVVDIIRGSSEPGTRKWISNYNHSLTEEENVFASGYRRSHGSNSEWINYHVVFGKYVMLYWR